MKRLALFVLLVSSVSVSWSADPTPPPAPIIIPDDPLPVPPTPPPVPDPSSNLKLNVGEVYVRRASKPCLVTTSPAGVLDVKKKTGPVSIYAKLAGGDGTYGWHDYSEPFVFVVTAIKTGTAELMITPVGATDEKDIVRRMIDANVAPLPPPIPPIPPTPPDPPDPFEASAPAFRVLIVYDDATRHKLPKPQQDLLESEVWRKYVESKGTWRCFDKNTVLTNAPAPFVKAMAKAGATPYLLAGNGKTGFSGPLPANVDDLMVILKKVGG